MIMEYGSCDIPAKTMIRYTAAPTKYDTAPYSTVCTVHLNDDGTDRRLYIQISKNEQEPHWESVEEVVIRAFKPLFDNPCFIAECLSKQ